MARAAARAAARPRRARRRATGRTCSPPGGSSSSGSPSRAPCVLVFEDMQWAEPGLLDFVEHLLEWSRSLPLFVLALARPELPSAGAWPARRATRRRSASSRSAARRWMRCSTVSCRACPASCAREILARAEGVPLYAVETVRMLLDRGLLAREGDAYRPTGPIEELEVPETLHALLAARLDGLTPEERRARPGRVRARQDLHEAGRRRALAAATRPRSSRSCSALVRKEVLTLQADPRSPERGQFGFLQDLLKRVAYETLSKARPQGAPPGGRAAPRDGLGGRAGDRRGGRRPLPRGVPPAARMPTTPPRSRHRRGTRSPAPASAQRRWPRPSRPPASSRRPPSSPTTRSRRRGCATGPDAPPTAAETWRRRGASWSARTSSTQAAGRHARSGARPGHAREHRVAAAPVRAGAGAAPGRLRRARRGRAGRGVRRGRGGARRGSVLHGRPRGGPAHGRRRARRRRAALAAGDALPGAEHGRPDRRRRRAAGSRATR